MRALIVPPEFGERHDERRCALIESDSPLATESFEVEFLRRDGSRFPGEATVSKVDIRGEVFVSGFITDVTERVRRDAEREALLREQAARAEAERVADLVGAMQALVDAALAHRTLDDILRELVTQVRGVLDADAATIYLADEEERLSVGRLDPGRDLRRRRVREDGGARRARRCSPTTDPASEGGRLVSASRCWRRARSPACWWRAPRAARVFGGEDLTLLRLAAERVGLAIAHARVYEREHRIAETLQRSLLPDHLPTAARPGRGGALPPGRLRGRGGRRLVRRDSDGGRRRRARDGRRGGQGPRGGVHGRSASQRAARVRARGPRRRARRGAAQPAAVDRGGGQPDGDDALRDRRPGREQRSAG